MRLIDADALKEYCMRASKSDDDLGEQVWQHWRA